MTSDEIKQARLSAGRNWAEVDSAGLSYTADAEFSREFVFLACEYIEKTEATRAASCGCPPRICIACGLSEPCGLRCPGPDGQPDPDAPLVCEFDKTYKELCEENRRLRQAIDAARNAPDSAQGSVASTASIVDEGEAS